MRAKLHVAIIGLFLSAQAGAVSVPNTFSAGQPAKAAEVNANFTALENAINARGSTSFGSEYFISPSTNGQLTGRNVIVLKENRGGSGGCQEDVYRVRVYFENTENISLDTPGGPVTPDRLWMFGFVCAPSGSATASYILEYLYAIPSTGSFADALGIEINEDAEADGSFETQTNYNYFQTYNVNPLNSAELVHSTEMYRNGSGETLVANNVSSVSAILGKSLTVGAPLGETFSNVMVQSLMNYTGGNGGRIRFRAPGIGVVQEINDASVDDPLFNSQVKADAIYYRIEGQGTAGDLSGTPFDSGSGGNAAGIWFQ